MNDEILEEIKRFAKLPREHASFYNWHEKGIKESGIVDYFLDKKNHKGAHEFVSFCAPKKDPPDAWLYDKNQNKTALEITELVNRSAIDAQIHNKPEYWIECEKWANIHYFQNQINERIQEKQQKCSALFDQGINVELLLHTDEMWLESCYQDHLNNVVEFEAHSFKKIWLMLSYSPHTQSCPVVLLCKNV